MHASGVLAVVVAGLIIAYVAPRISTAASRRQTEAAWPLGPYVLNGSLFVLIGLQVQAVAQDIPLRDLRGCSASSSPCGWCCWWCGSCSS